METVASPEVNSLWSTSDGVSVGRKSRIHIGTGCLSRSDYLPNHNPEPRTERGKRRHANRNDQRRKEVAEKHWYKARSNRPSRFQQRLGKSKI